MLAIDQTLDHDFDILDRLGWIPVQLEQSLFRSKIFFLNSNHINSTLGASENH